MKRLLLHAAAGLALMVALPAAAAEVGGATLPETVSADGRTLKLNGSGIRTKLMFKVYAAGLYLETPSRDPKAILGADAVKRMHLAVLRTLAASKITEAISEGFERNSKDQLPALRDRLNRFNGMFADVVKGDVILMTYVPGKGTVVSVKGAERGTIDGKDFADALFAVWLGPNPVQEDLKKALLGNSG